jgi:hypothetical protein
MGKNGCSHETLVYWDITTERKQVGGASRVDCDVLEEDRTGVKRRQKERELILQVGRGVIRCAECLSNMTFGKCF